ncbi:MAG: ribonuclease P protein subunit [Thermoplasmatota archaeon]|nr:ribonuclease P protein subunit [Halobacteriales archaeon]
MKRSLPRLGDEARRVARGELIGQDVRIAASGDVGIVGLAGTVIDESLRTFVIRKADGREVRVGKTGSTFEFLTPGGPVQVVGDAIEFRPADRTKKVR